MKKLPATFARSESGREPVREFLSALGKPDSTLVGKDIKIVEMGWPVGMPVCRPLGEGLWEIRSSITGGRAARIIFCIHNESMCLLHGFIKKTRATPKADLDLARHRKANLR